MSRVARSTKPLYQTRNRPISWRIRMTNPGGSVINLTGATAQAVLRAREVNHSLHTGPGCLEEAALSIGPLGPDGIILVTGTPEQSNILSAKVQNSLHVTLTDSQGVATDYVWPVVGEDP